MMGRMCRQRVPSALLGVEPGQREAFPSLTRHEDGISMGRRIPGRQDYAS
jgi:hypothetical protein